MKCMGIQELAILYKNWLSSDWYLVLNVVLIVFSFFSGNISAKVMCSQIAEKKYAKIFELIKIDKDKLNKEWKEAYSYLSKANTYMCLAIFLFVQFVLTILTMERDGITTTVVMFTIAVSIMEYRDNKNEFKKREKVVSEKHLDLILQAEELKNMEFQDRILTELENSGIIDKEKRKEIIKSFSN